MGTLSTLGYTLPPLTHPVPRTVSVSITGIRRTNTYSDRPIHRVSAVKGVTATIGITSEDAAVAGETLSVGIGVSAMDGEANEGTRAGIVISRGTFVRNTLSVRGTGPAWGALVVVVAGGGHTEIHFANPPRGAVGVNSTCTAFGDTLSTLTHPVPRTLSVSTAGIRRTNTYSGRPIHRVSTVGVGGTATIGIIIEDAATGGEALSVGGDSSIDYDGEANEGTRASIVVSRSTVVRDADIVNTGPAVRAQVMVSIAVWREALPSGGVASPACGAVGVYRTCAFGRYTMAPLAPPPGGTVRLHHTRHRHANTYSMRHILCRAALKTCTTSITPEDTAAGGQTLSVRGGDSTYYNWETNKRTRTGLVISDGAFVRDALSVRITGPALGALCAVGTCRWHTEAP